MVVINSHLVGYPDVPDDLKMGVFTGWSESPKKGGTNAEKTNPLEVCETSAVGRALGFAGFGDLESIASAEEVQQALERAADEPPTASQKRFLGQLLKQHGTVGDEAIAAAAREKFGKSAKSLSGTEVSEWITALKAVEPEVRF